MLLVAEPQIAQELLPRLGDGGEVRCLSDPYQALREMADRRDPLVLLATNGQQVTSAEDFVGLCRASRRVCPDARIVAICPPAMEPLLRELASDVLDDYFIYPPTRKELSAIVQLASASPAVAPGSARPAPPQAERPSVILAAAALTTTDYSRLVSATFSRADLEKCISQIVTSRISQPVQWIDGPGAPAGATVLLKATDATPRLLVVEGVYSPAGPARAFLLALEEVAPSLWSTAKRTEALHHMAITDELTGAYNRRYFYHVTDQIISRPSQQGRPVTLLLYDIDDFKTYNDRYGYAVGDEILCQTSAMMRQITRSQDIVARIGGDEFAVLFWDKEAREADSKPPETAYVLANRFLSAVQSHRFPSLGAKGKGVVTISGGLASYPADGSSCRDLLRKANAALRDVKRSGKKAIRIVGPVNGVAGTRP